MAILEREFCGKQMNELHLQCAIVVVAEWLSLEFDFDFPTLLSCHGVIVWNCVNLRML